MRPARFLTALSPSRGCLSLGRVAGIPVLLHWSWFVVAVIEITARRRTYSSLSWNAIEYLALFGIVLLHELGHAVVGGWVGGRAERIVLWPLGGAAYLFLPPRPGPSLAGFAGGPLVNLLLIPVSLAALVAAGLGDWMSPESDAWLLLRNLSLFNVVLLILNLLPIYPLDGGQILHALLWFFLGRARSLKLVSFLGLAGSVTLAGVCLFRGNWLIAIICMFLVGQACLGFVAGELLSRPGWESLVASQTYLHLQEYKRACAQADLALAAVRDDVSRVQGWHRRGIAHLGLGERDRSLADLDEAVRLAPHETNHFTRGVIQRMRGAFGLAVADFTWVLNRNPAHAQALYLRGEALLAAGDAELAAADLQGAWEMDSRLPETYPAPEPLLLAWCRDAAGTPLKLAAGMGPFKVASALAERGDLEGALASYTEALRQNPTLNPALVCRAETYRALGQPGLALGDLDEALRQEPDNATAHILRGQALRELGDDDKALASFDKAVEAGPCGIVACLYRADIYQGRGELTRAVAECGEVLRRDMDNALAHEMRGVVRRKLGDLAGAIADYTAALRLTPGETRLHYLRGIALMRQGNVEHALADYQEAVRLAPDNGAAWNNLAYLWGTWPQDAFRDGAKAVEAATRACELIGWQDAGYVDTLAAACAEAGDFASAVKWQKAALEIPLAQLGDAALERLRLFESGQPYRQPGAPAAREGVLV